EAGIELFEFDERYEEIQKNRLRAFLQQRNNTLVREALRDLREAWRSGANCIPAIQAAVRVGATEGEIMGLFREEAGTYVDPAVV
ncbi:MAG TPA: methylmalonyl-CoA mutase family protein, partial [Limnochorda sp.]